jgi:hypothetical protein
VKKKSHGRCLADRTIILEEREREKQLVKWREKKEDFFDQTRPKMPQFGRNQSSSEEKTFKYKSQISIRLF